MTIGDHRYRILIIQVFIQCLPVSLYITLFLSCIFPDDYEFQNPSCLTLHCHKESTTMESTRTNISQTSREHIQVRNCSSGDKMNEIISRDIGPLKVKTGRQQKEDLEVLTEK